MPALAVRGSLPSHWAATAAFLDEVGAMKVAIESRASETSTLRSVRITPRKQGAWPMVEFRNDTRTRPTRKPWGAPTSQKRYGFPLPVAVMAGGSAGAVERSASPGRTRMARSNHRVRRSTSSPVASACRKKASMVSKPRAWGGLQSRSRRGCRRRARRGSGPPGSARPGAARAGFPPGDGARSPRLLQVLHHDVDDGLGDAEPQGQLPGQRGRAAVEPDEGRSPGPSGPPPAPGREGAPQRPTASRGRRRAPPRRRGGRPRGR